MNERMPSPAAEAAGLLGSNIVKLMNRHDPLIARNGLVGAIVVYLAGAGMTQPDLDQCLDRLMDDVRKGFAVAREGAH